MDAVDYLVVGAGVTGLAFANAIRAEAASSGRPEPSVLILEADATAGGYCKTVKRSGFVWDYSGHFFHFRHPEIEAWLRERMAGCEIRTVVKKANIWFEGREIDFPFQKNIHQLARPDFIDCLVSLYFREPATEPPRSFAEMVVQRFGRGIADRFLLPYNQKLYAADPGSLDPDAMGRFFPFADIDEIIRNMAPRPAAGEGDASYNASFTYPLGGAIEYITALLRDLPRDTLSYREPLVSIDLEARRARTPRREIAYRHVVSSVPLPALAAMCGLEPAPGALRWSKVLVFNLGFDRKGPEGVHWTYFPGPAISFYRVGYYDNIMGAERMSLYVEIGVAAGEAIDVESARRRVLADLETVGIIDGHELLDWHSVVLDPAYVHITGEGIAEAERLRGQLAAAGVHSAGRYGAWTYCSIEDNIVEARQLAAELALKEAPAPADS
jgi:protoporphyrinogen oxidase